MPQTHSVGIDVSKSKLDVNILGEEKEVSARFSNDHEGIENLKNHLIENKVENTTQIVIESTGDYHLLVSNKLTKQGFNVQVINPIITKRKLSGSIRKIKSDKTDSKALAEIGKELKLDTHKLSVEELHKRKLIAQINAIQKHRAALKLSLKNTQDTLRKFNLELSAAEGINEAIKHLDKSLKLLFKQLSELTKKSELVKSLEGVVGIGNDTATIVVAMLEDREFKTKASLVAYAGLDVSIKESGNWKGRTRLSKRGNAFLRKYLINIAWGLLRHNEKFQRWIEKYKNEGRKYKELLVIIARKFLKMLFAAFKTSSFDINFIDLSI